MLVCLPALLGIPVFILDHFVLDRNREYSFPTLMLYIIGIATLILGVLTSCLAKLQSFLFGDINGDGAMQHDRWVEGRIVRWRVKEKGG
jgi:hypothetical protein